MAWQDVMIPMLRIIINDFNCDDLTYSDNQLGKTLAVSAMYIEQELSFTTDYTITINPPDIDPDPTVTATLDDEFRNFVVLKAACLTSEWDLRAKSALIGLRARAGSLVELDVKGEHLEGYKLLIEKGPCGALEQLKMEWKFGNANNIRGILSPFISNDFDPRYLLGGYGPR